MSVFALIAFGVLWRFGQHPPEMRAINLDTDWIYRRFGPSVIGLVVRSAGVIVDNVVQTVKSKIEKFLRFLIVPYKYTGEMILIMILLGT